MAQPDFEEIARHLDGISKQILLIGNHPALKQKVQMLATIQEMEDRLTTKIAQSEQRTMACIDETNARIDQINARIVELAQAQQTNDKKSLARALNSSALVGEARLYPLPLPNGDETPEGQFPNTLNELRELEGARLAGLLEAYKLVVPPGASVYDKQGILAKHCGIRTL